MRETKTVDCVVVGAGPAGLTAAIYLRRYLRAVSVVDHGHSRALGIEWSYNYPGFPQGISGADLLRRLRAQLIGVQGVVTAAEVISLHQDSPDAFTLQCSGFTWRSRTVLLATGLVDSVPAVAGIESLQNKGLLRQCPICDGYEHRGQRIVVLGDGEHAAKEAAFIANYSPRVAQAGLTQVPIATRLDVRILHGLATSVQAASTGGVHIALSNGDTEHFDVAYAAQRPQPRSQLGSAMGAEVDAHGNLVIDMHGATRIRGLYAAGDVVSGLDQMVVAASHGATAATAIHNLLLMSAP